MQKKIAVVLVSLLSSSSFAAMLACPQAVPTNSPGFCASFKSVAACHCTESHQSPKTCNDMKTMYQMMLVLYGSLQKACNAQKYTTPQTCIDDWNCYRSGGKDSAGRLCSSTGKACE